MSVNLRFGINPEYTKHMGPLFHTIDFDSNDAFPAGEYKDKNTRLNAGTFFIDDKSYSVKYEFIRRQVKDLTVIVNKLLNSKAKNSEITEWEIQGKVWHLTKKETIYLLETFAKAKRTIEVKYKCGM